MFKWILSKFIKKKRTKFVYVDYLKANDLIKQGWSIAKEEDNNSVLGKIYLEFLE
jgi:hypothetical protein